MFVIKKIFIIKLVWSQSNRLYISSKEIEGRFATYFQLYQAIPSCPRFQLEIGETTHLCDGKQALSAKVTFGTNNV